MLVVLCILIFAFKKLRHPGFIGGAWVFGYGASRILVEFFREPDAHIGYLACDWLTLGMFLSLPLLAIGIWGMATASGRTPWRKPGDDEAEA